MFKNKDINGRNNISGKNIAKLRKLMDKPNSQQALANKMQLIGIDLDFHYSADAAAKSQSNNESQNPMF